MRHRQLSSPESTRPTRSPVQLARHFGARAHVTRDGVRTLYEALVGDDATPSPGRAALEGWKRRASSAYGHDLDGASPMADALAEHFGLADRSGLGFEPRRPAELLFAVQTYYALVVKLLVWQTLASRHGTPTAFDRLSRAPTSGQLQGEVARLEAGGVLKDVGVVAPWNADPFSWYTAAWDEPVERLVRRLADRLRPIDAGATADGAGASRDLLKGLYEDLFPKPVRHALGEYYTPDWLARRVLDDVGYRGEPDARLLDPACGSGTFLVAAINRIRARWEAAGRTRGWEPGRLCRAILAGVVGFDLNPLAVLSSRANYLIAIGDLLGRTDGVRVPVFLRDAILGPNDWPEHGGGECAGGDRVGRFDFVVGNPPWIAWDDLPDDYRERTKPLWHHYGLFSLSASDARHGGGKKDVSMLLLYAAADRYLKAKGRLGMVITQTLFQTKGAGDGFRRFRLGRGGAWLRVLGVNDLVACRPFPEAANWTATITLEKGSPTAYPVPYVKWSPEARAKDHRRDTGVGQVSNVPGTMESCSTHDPEARPEECGGEPPMARRRYQAEPIDADRPTSPWVLRPEGLKTPWARLVGPSDYQAHLGANSGGANAVYWVRVLGAVDGGLLVRNVTARAKRGVESVEQVIEPDLLYPLARWGDVTRYGVAPSCHLLLTQDVATRRGIDEPTMQARYPRTYAYLKRFADVLTGRAAYRRYQQRAAFYSMYNVGSYTIAPIKVVWRRMDKRMRAAVVEPVDHPLVGRRPVIPQETCVLVAADSADEAHYLCAVVNSAPVNFLVASHSVRGGKGFGTPSILDYVRLRRFEREDPRHLDLAGASRQAHEATQRGEPVAEIQHAIDRLAARLWGLKERELEVIRGELGSAQE